MWFRITRFDTSNPISRTLGRGQLDFHRLLPNSDFKLATTLMKVAATKKETTRLAKQFAPRIAQMRTALGTVGGEIVHRGLW